LTEAEKIKLLTGESDENLITVVLEDAESFVLGYTNRSKLIPALKKPVRDLAVIALNRMGTEGETGRSEGGERYSFDTAPKHIYVILNQYRLVRVGGKVYENQTQSSEDIPSPA